MNHLIKSKNNYFNKILVASRGEIAVRIIKTIHKLNISSVAIFTPEEKGSLHVQMASESHQLSGIDSLAAFLDVYQIVALAKKIGVDAIHPGYGFLSENPIFSELCHKNGITFIGPSAGNIALMGDKSAAIAMAKLAKIPTIEGSLGNIQTILNQKDTLHFPLLVKPAFGGGGKGMIHVLHPEKLEEALHKASAEALRYFSNDAIIVEHFIEDPRHIEVQILGDNFGKILHLFERECSVQRRFQKIIEETPAPNLSSHKRDEIIADALKLANYIGYTNAGTVEFLLDKNGNHFFIEMNTRIQVEHPITEEVTGIDIVELQIEVAANMPLKLNQNDIRQNGFAIECRINAENPSDNFNPSPGDVFWLNKKEFNHIRIDTALKNHSKIVPSFDSLIAKVITHGQNRDEAIDTMLIVLDKLAIKSAYNNISYLKNVLKNSSFRDGKYSTTFCNYFRESLLNELDRIIPSDHFFQIGWSLIRLIRHFKNHLNESKVPINSFQNLWTQTEFGQTHLLIVWKSNQSASITVNNKNSYDVTAIDICDNSLTFKINGEHISQLYMTIDAETIICQQMHFLHVWEVGSRASAIEAKEITAIDKDDLTSPIPCRVVSVNVSVGDVVAVGDTLAIIEAMKMENTLKAWKAGTVTEVNTKAGDAIKSGAVILKIGLC